MARLAGAVAVVLNVESITKEVMEVVHKVAMDTSRGISLEIVKYLYKKGQPMSFTALQVVIDYEGKDISRILSFLSSDMLGVIEKVKGQRDQVFWGLTDKMIKLYEGVIDAKS